MCHYFIFLPLDVILQKFYFLDIQALCELKELKKERWLPCEMAVVEFSLAYGIHRSIHQFIHPGNSKI